MTLTKNEIKDIIKVIKSLENRGILLKELPEKLLVKKGFLSFLRPLMTAGLPLMKSVLMLLAKSFIPFRLSAGLATRDAAMQREFFGSGTIASIISNKKMEDIMKIVKSLEEWGLLRFSPAFIRYIKC